MAAPAFPNFLETRQTIPRFVWQLGRLLSVAAAAGFCYLCFHFGKLALILFWKVVIPVLPAIFFITPGLWRNLCPLAATNQLPRLLRISLAKELPAGLKRYANVIGISALFAVVPLRKVFLQDDVIATMILVITALSLAFVGGILFKGKSGWCGSFCPILPVQRAYGQTPLLSVNNSQCKPCVACTKNCYDFNPQVAYLADLYDNERHLGGDRKFFIAALPGFLFAFFTLPRVPEISLLELYKQTGFYTLMTIGGFYVLETYIKVSVYKITAFFSVLCLNLFYWYVLPGFIGALLQLYRQYVPVEYYVAIPPQWSHWSLWIARGMLIILSLLWLLKTYKKEALFLSQILSSNTTRAPAAAITRFKSGTGSGKPEVILMPENKTLNTDPDKSLLQVLEDNDIRIEAGCRMGVCGADPVAVIEGLENLDEPGGDERATLERLGFAANTRMACSTRACGQIKVSLTPERSTTPVASANIDFEPDHNVESVVIIGNGIAGSTAADTIRRHHENCEIHVVGNEKYPLYNRMGISRLIYGRSAMQGLTLLPDEWYDERRITTWLNTRAVSIDLAAKNVMLATDQPLPYDRLILAMGSSSIVPEIRNFGIDGTFALRNADDAMSMRAYAQQHLSKTAVVAGGGLLGLETAYALAKLGLDVTVLERGKHLLQRQLDKSAAGHLQIFIRQLGIKIKYESEVSSVQGDDRLQSVTLKSRHKLHTDMLVVTAGVRANLELVEDTTIDINRAVKVNRYLETSLHGVYAVGDLAEPESGNVYGLWPVAVEQGRIAGINAIGGKIPYIEQAQATMLKVVGLDLLSVGEIDNRNAEAIVFEDKEQHRYRKLLVRKNKIIGAILLGYPQFAPLITKAVQSQLKLSNKQLRAIRCGNWNGIKP